MPTFNLGEKFGKTMGAEPSKNKVFFPSIQVNKSLPDDFEVGQAINGSFKGKIVSMSERSTQTSEKVSFTIEVMNIDMQKGKVSVKEFEKMSDSDQEEVLEKSRK